MADIKPKYNFDTPINRQGSNCIKHDKTREFLGFQDVLPMWVADMDFETPPFIMEAIRKRAEHPILGYSFRPDSHQEAIVDWLQARHSWSVQSNEIAFSPGVVPGIYLALKGFTQEGDEIIAQPPVYFPFFSTVTENQRTLILNPLKENNLSYEMDWEDLEAKITSKTKMLLLSNPHNPVGRAWKKEELEKLVDICHKNQIIILSDEIHSDLIMKGNRHQVVADINAKAAEITLTFMAPSKTFNLAGLSSSFLVAKNPDLLTNYQKMLDATHLGLGNVFGNVATEAAYRHGGPWLDQLLDYLEGNAQLVFDFIQKYPHIARTKMPEATYLLWLDLRPSGLTEDEIARLFFAEAKLGINPGALFGQGGEGFVRINVAMPRSKVKQAIQQLELAFQGIQSLKKS
jgi:cystathionine beta-lyase